MQATAINMIDMVGIGLLSIVDAMIWSELGTAFPKAGKLMSFLFVWQTMIQAPLVIASAAIGFSKYFSYLVPLTSITSKLVSGSVVILIVFLLYRKIEQIGKICNRQRTVIALGILAYFIKAKLKSEWPFTSAQ